MDYRVSASKLVRFARSVEYDVPITIGVSCQGYDSSWRPMDKTVIQDFRAMVAHFERGGIYLYKNGARSNHSGRLAASCFFVPKGKNIAERESFWSIRFAIAGVLGGHQTEKVGCTTFSVSVSLNSHATELVATFHASWDLTEEERKNWELRYALAPRYMTVDWSTNWPEAVAMGRSAVYGEMPLLGVLDWWSDYGPENRKSQVLEAILHTQMATDEQLRKATTKRTKAADAAFDSYDMGDMVITHGLSGWVGQDDPDEWHSPFFVGTEDGPSRRLVFVVRFAKGTSEVSDAYIAH